MDMGACILSLQKNAFYLGALRSLQLRSCLYQNATIIFTSVILGGNALAVKLAGLYFEDLLRCSEMK